MKILHIIPALTKGGAERVVLDLANQAARDRHQVTILAAVDAPRELLANWLLPEVELRFIAPAATYSRRVYKHLPLWILQNRRWLLEQDVVHCHLTLGSVFGTLLQALRFASGQRTPAVVETYHAVGMAIPKRDRALHSALLGTRDAAAFMAEDAYWTAYRAARPNRLFRTILNGVSGPPAVDQASSDRYRLEQARIPDGVIVLGSVGRLVRDRRPDLLLDAFAKLTQLTNSNVHLLLAGEGPMRSELELESRRRGLASRVHLPGLIRNPADAFGIIDLYLTVNVGPVTGVAAIEAAFAGLPIVAIQLDGSHQRAGDEWIWASHDPEELAGHLDNLLKRDVELGRLAQKQQAFARANHSVEAMADAYGRLYQEALALRRFGAGKSG